MQQKMMRLHGKFIFRKPMESSTLFIESMVLARFQITHNTFLVRLHISETFEDRVKRKIEDQIITTENRDEKIVVTSIHIQSVTEID